jgi:hypothetical protein
MRLLGFVLLVSAMFIVTFGCGNKEFSGPKVDKFTGKVTAGGKQITIPADYEVTINLQMDGVPGKSFGIPVKPDGTWQITWMPTGAYIVTVEKTNLKATKGAPDKRVVPEKFNVEAGKTEYSIDLGKNWK